MLQVRLLIIMINFSRFKFVIYTLSNNMFTSYKLHFYTICYINITYFLQ